MRTFVIAFLAGLTVLGCASGPQGKPEEATAAQAPPRAPKNLLAEQDRSQLYFDLDRYTTSYMAARAEGNARSFMSLHASVLMPMVDRNVDELLRTLKTDEEIRYRIIAARGLGFGSNEARTVPALVDVLGDEDAVLVSSALVSLYLLGSEKTPIPPLNQLLNHPDPLVRSNDALALSVVFRARRKAGMAGLTTDVRESAGRLMALATNSEEDPFVRGHAAAAIGAIGDSSAADVLINLLLDDHTIVRVKAAQGLGTIGRESAIEPLIKAMELAESTNERKIVAASIEKIARALEYPCDLKALGTDAANWRTWYAAIKRER